MIKRECTAPTNITPASSFTHCLTRDSTSRSLHDPGGPDISSIRPGGSPPSRILSRGVHPVDCSWDAEIREDTARDEGRCDARSDGGPRGARLADFA